MQLKADMETASAAIRGKNAARAEARLRQEAEHRAEKEKLVNMGLNPYKVPTPLSPTLSFMPHLR